MALALVSPAQMRCAGGCDLCLIYARESKTDAKSGNRSPDEQIDAGIAWCAGMPCSGCGHLGIEPVEVDGQVGIIEPETGASRHSRSKGIRPKWDIATDILTNGWAGRHVTYFYTWGHARATRKLDEYTDLRRLCASTNTLWSYGGKIYDLNDGGDRFRTGIDALVAEKDVEEIRTNVLRSVEANATAGRPNGKMLFGYKRIYDESTGAFLREEAHPEQAPIVVWMFEQYLAGKSCPTIARELKAKGIRTNGKDPAKNQWTAIKVRQALRRQSYIAKRTLRGEVVGDACWPALVTEDLFWSVQTRMDELGEAGRAGHAAAKATRRRQKNTAHLLTIALECGKCDGRMHTIVRKTKTMGRRRSYQCRERYCTARDLERMNVFFTDLVLERLRRRVVAARAGRGPSAESLQLADLRAQVKRKKKKLAEATAAYERDDISITTLSAIEAGVRTAIAELEQAERRVAVPLRIDIPEPDRLVHWWEHELTPEVRREIVGQMFVRIRVLPIGKGAKFSPTSLEWEWREW